MPRCTNGFHARTSVRQTFNIAIGAAVTFVLNGCQSADMVGGAAPREVSVADFARGQPMAESAPAVAGAEQPAIEDTVSAARSETAPSAAPPVAPPGPPSSPTQSRRPGEEVIVESVIGQVSGRPIFAEEFLEPIADQLRSEGERLSQAEFLPRAREIIQRRLSEVVINELFLAEAEASLTEQEQMGLLAFLRDLQEKAIAERGGTLFGAERRIAAEQEMTIEEFQEAQKSSLLIQKLLYERIEPRVIVSWRDVQREYERRRSEFNPPAQVTLLRLQLTEPDQNDLIERVKQRLDVDHEDFNIVVQQLELAEFVGVFTGQPLTMGPGGLRDLEVADAFKPALEQLQGVEGETTHAIGREGRVVWLHVEKIDQPVGKSLFDVQQQLIAELRARRQLEERDKYVRTLFEQGIYDELEAMSRRALLVATLRYARN